MLYYVIEKVNVERVLEVRAIIVGRERLTIREYCRRHGLNPHRVYNYKKKHNLSYEEVIRRYEEGEITQRRAYEIEGLSLKEYCRKEGLSYSAIYSYMQRHKVSAEEALEVYKGTGNRNTYYYIEGMSLRAWCIKHKSYNDYRGILYYKKEHNCSVEEAVRGYYDNRNE